MMIMQESRMGK